MAAPLHKRRRGTGIPTRFARWAAPIESPRIVVAALRRASADVHIGAVAEPLELLCRSLDRESGLRTGPRRAARRRLTEALVRRSELLGASSSTSPPAPLLVAGAPGSPAASRLRRALLEGGFDIGVAGPPRDPDNLEPLLAAGQFDLDWPVPAYSEWLDSSSHASTYSDLSAILAGAGGSPGWTLLGDWTHLEHLPALRQQLPAAVVIRVSDDPATEQRVVIATAIAARRETTGSSDDSTIARYWKWRLDRWRERVDSADPDLTVAAGAIEDDLSEVLAEVSEVAGLCQAG